MQEWLDADVVMVVRLLEAMRRRNNPDEAAKEAPIPTRITAADEEILEALERGRAKREGKAD